jgi:tetratricopeptide (TPR) repeat protein
VKGELDLAIAEMQEQIRLYPQPRRDSLIFMGIIYQKQGKKRLAFAAYRAALLQGGLGGNMFLRLALETTGTPKDLFKAYRDAVRTDPGHWQLQRTFLNVCLKLGTTPEVHAALEADISLLREKARLQANNPHFRLNLGTALLAHGDRKEAAVEFRKALELMQKDPAECNEVAWTLATSAEVNQRYGSIAVEFAIRACELTEWKDANSLDSLAAAHAEAGDFDSAVRRQTEAISLLSDASEKEDFGRRLKLYRDRMPFRDSK